MFVAHTAPSDGPAGLLYLSEFVTAPLFAVLIGMGMWLGWSRIEQRAGARGRFVAGVAVRAAALIATGLLLERLPAQVLIVLVHLGVLMLVVVFVVRLPSTVVAGIGLSSAVLGSVLKSELATVQARLVTQGHPDLAELLDIVAGGSGGYRLTHLLAWSCLGIILARRSQLTGGFLGSHAHGRATDRTTWQLVRGDALIATGALVVGAAIVAARAAGSITLLAYQGTVQEVAFDGLLCVAAVCGGAAIVRLVPQPVVRPVAFAGAMTLTMYVAHVLVLSVFTAWAPANSSDDSWPMLVGLVIGSLHLPCSGADGRNGCLHAGPARGFRRPWCTSCSEGLA